MEIYTYTGDFCDIKTQEYLPEEGVLNGQYGTLHFKRCEDGYAIYDTSFQGSGFVCTPTSANIAYPNFINGVPVTEIHNSIEIKLYSYMHPIAIEGSNIKRAYLSIARKTAKDEPCNGDGLGKLIMACFDAMDGNRAKSELLEISIDFYNWGHTIDLCEIRCNEKCILKKIAAKKLEVIAPSVVLSGRAYEFLEYIKVSGRIFPNTYSDWDGDVQDTDYFQNIESLRFIEGSLCGDTCWSFRGCTSLEHVHLASGMQIVPPYAFANCSSLVDLFVPDTVSQLGEYAFAGCGKLARIHLPSNIKKIPKGLFKNCSSLEKCFLSDSIEEIEDEAFMGCTILRKPWIPKGIKRIGDTAFDNPSWR